MTISADTALVTAAVLLAALWLMRRAWVRARDRYRDGPCCGEGCGCVKPALFGPKKGPSKPPDSNRR